MAVRMYKKLCGYECSVGCERSKWVDCQSMHAYRTPRRCDVFLSHFKTKLLHLQKRYDALVYHGETLCSLSGCLGSGQCYRQYEGLSELLLRYLDEPVGPEIAACQVMRAIEDVEQVIINRDRKLADREDRLIRECDGLLRQMNWGFDFLQQDDTKANFEFADQWEFLLAEADQEIFEDEDGVESNTNLIELLLELQDLTFGVGVRDVRIAFGVRHGIELLRDRSPHEMRDVVRAQWYLNRLELMLEQSGIRIAGRQRLITEFFLQDDMFTAPQWTRMRRDPHRDFLVTSKQQLITDFFPSGRPPPDRRVEPIVTETSFCVIDGTDQLFRHFLYAVLDQHFCWPESHFDVFADY